MVHMMTLHMLGRVVDEAVHEDILFFPVDCLTELGIPTRMTFNGSPIMPLD